MLLIISYLVAVNECQSETPKADNLVVYVVVIVGVVLTVEFLWWVVGVGGWVCTVIFVSTPSPTDLD